MSFLYFLVALALILYMTYIIYKNIDVNLDEVTYISECSTNDLMTSWIRSYSSKYQCPQYVNRYIVIDNRLFERSLVSDECCYFDINDLKLVENPSKLLSINKTLYDSDLNIKMFRILNDGNTIQEYIAIYENAEEGLILTNVSSDIYHISSIKYRGNENIDVKDYIIYYSKYHITKVLYRGNVIINDDILYNNSDFHKFLYSCLTNYLYVLPL